MLFLATAVKTEREDQEGMGVGSAVRKVQAGGAELGPEGLMTAGSCVAGC